MTIKETSKSLDREAMSLARESTGGVAWGTIALCLGVAIAYAAVFVAVATGHLGMAAGFVINSLLVYASYTILHEAVHGNISGFGQPTRWYNEALGILAGFMMSIPLTIHRTEHLAHHRKTNDPEADPDMWMAANSPVTFVSLIRASFISIARQYTRYAESWPKATNREKGLVAVEVLGIVGIRGGLAMAGFAQEVLWLTILANLVGNLIIVTFFAVAVHHPNSATGRYVDTSTILFRSWVNTPITWAWLWQNYHSVHHLFPRVPFYRYAKVFDRIREIMVKQGATIHEIG
ncbi:MAG: fatty acid desaturase [Myxococcota bacterium]|jgi:beta-carotene hydroxylase|nr:fatty acid desaturase [Myxococcota bacterium]